MRAARIDPFVGVDRRTGVSNCSSQTGSARSQWTPAHTHTCICIYIYILICIYIYIYICIRTKAISAI